ncbi:MAG: hypothetical protein GWN13_06300 [Phycisphaerae bacterium]|nr:hypothetical protein [Phycisphaerae bacterium]
MDGSGFGCTADISRSGSCRTDHYGLRYRANHKVARLLAYDTQQGHWYEATHYYDPQYYSGLGWWHYGGRVAGTGQYHSRTRKRTYLIFNGASGSYNTLTPGIYYCGSISGYYGAGGNYIVAYDTNKVWFYNPAYLTITN